MSLYAIGDLHLHFQVPLKARAQMKDRIWKNHEEKFKRYCEEFFTSEDTLVLLGDHSWGHNLTESEEDMRYISALPGRKILLRGNHDMFWDVAKTESLNRCFQGQLLFLQNNYYPYREYALVGTKGYTFEGPFYLNSRGHIIGWDEEAEEHARKLIEREAKRLRCSFEAAKADGYCKFIMFLHYPPTSILEEESVFTAIAEEYGTEYVIYAHCHGEQRFHDSIEGMKNGVHYSLASGDYLKWKPMKVFE